MGGSLALAIKEKYPRVSVWGFARKESTFRKLSRLKLLDRVERDLAGLVRDSDIVIMALPVYSVIEYFKKIAPHLKKGAIVTDIGSSKALIETAAKKTLPAYVHFVGSHPLCGSEKNGAEFARATLYKNTLCVITSSKKDIGAQKIKKIWTALGVKVIFVPSVLHDKLLSLFSHLPHMVSFALTSSVSPGRLLPIIPASFKELTRISGSSAEVWADIFLSNKRNILHDTAQFIKNIQVFQRAIQVGDRKKIIRYIGRVNRAHKKLIHYYS
jgi:prephenate dehydrogenase